MSTPTPTPAPLKRYLAFWHASHDVNPAMGDLVGDYDRLPAATAALITTVCDTSPLGSTPENIWGDTFGIVWDSHERREVWKSS